MLIAETLALIALDPPSGRTREKLQKAHGQFALATGLLIELATQMRLGLRGKVVVALDNLPSRHRMLTTCLKIARTHSGLSTAQELVEMVAIELPNLREDLLDGLVRRDILHPPTRKFKFFGAKHYPVRSTQAQNEGFDEIRRCANGENSKLSGVALLSLADATGCLEQLLLFNEAENAKARLRELHSEIKAELESDRADEEYSTVDSFEDSRLERAQQASELQSIALMMQLYSDLQTALRT